MVRDDVHSSIFNEQCFDSPVSNTGNCSQSHVVNMPTKDSLHSLTETEKKLYDRLVVKVNKGITFDQVIGCEEAIGELSSCLKPLDIYRGRGVKKTQSILNYLST